MNLDITIDAASYGSTVNQWMETGFEVRSGVRLIITATGSVNLWPQGPGYNSTPKGYAAVGPSMGGLPAASSSRPARAARTYR